MKEKSDAQQIAQANLMDTSSVLKVRLDANIILERVRIFLTGKVQTIMYDDKGKPYVHTEEIADPKANKAGIHWILNYVENIVNPQVVQGNFDYDQYQKYIAEIHDGLIYNLMNMLPSWEIDEDDYEPIIDMIMNMMQPFISRLIDNEERKSYAQSIQVKETSAVSTGSGLFK